eukprot:4626011-Amphidinium_carterae.1
MTADIEHGEDKNMEFLSRMEHLCQPPFSLLFVGLGRGLLETHKLVRGRVAPAKLSPGPCFDRSGWVGLFVLG